LRLYNM